MTFSALLTFVGDTSEFELGDRTQVVDKEDDLVGTVVLERNKGSLFVVGIGDPG